MKAHLLFSYIFCLLLVVAALPLPRRPRQPDPNEPSYIPTPGDHEDVPLPGQSGVYYHKPNKIAYAYYGDVPLKEHAKRVSINQQTFPENGEPMRLAGESMKKKNRKEALKAIPLRGKENLVRDEKPRPC